MDQASLTITLNNIKSIQAFIKEVRSDLIENGLDEAINISLKDLKVQLLYIINEKIRNIPTVPGKAVEPTEMGQEPTELPKSEHELLKFLTGVDPEKHDRARGFSELSDSGILTGHKNKGSNDANRVTIRMKIGPNDTAETHHAQAVEFINRAIFAIPGDGGKVEYFINPGIDLSKFVKIKCSTVTGTSDRKPYYGMSPTERFEKDKLQKGYAQWTLKQDAINDIVKRQFIKLNDIFEPIKNGDTEEAVRRVQNFGKNKVVEKLKEQTLKLHKKENLTPTTEAYSNIVTLVTNLILQKKITKGYVDYFLASTYSPGKEEEKDFFQEIRKAISFWKISNEEFWFKSLVDKAEKLIKEFKG